MEMGTISEVAELLKAKESTLYSWAEKGMIPCYKLNGLLRFDMEEIREWLKESRKAPCSQNKPARKGHIRQDIDSIVRKAIEYAK